MYLSAAGAVLATEAAQTQEFCSFRFCPVSLETNFIPLLQTENQVTSCSLC